jgi:hypothetical protein
MGSFGSGMVYGTRSFLLGTVSMGARCPRCCPRADKEKAIKARIIIEPRIILAANIM